MRQAPVPTVGAVTVTVTAAVAVAVTAAVTVRGLQARLST